MHIIDNNTENIRTRIYLPNSPNDVDLKILNIIAITQAWII